MLLAAVLTAYALAAKAPADGPLTPKERVLFQGVRCDGYRAAIQEAVSKATATTPSNATPQSIMQQVVAAMQRPASQEQATWDTCHDLALRDLEDFRARSIEVEAMTTLKRLATAMKSSFVEFQTLCPSTTPVPADIKQVYGQPFRSAPSDWDATWTCLSCSPFEGQPQYFQYAVTTNDKTKSFVITAKGYPRNNGKVRTLTLAGKVVGNEIKMSELTRK